ncbi:MAG TPA: hypothetical protein VKD72_33325 [Gemmataceae bacterium]|nr:hypothetical protein [Gemmataceae bacterium]
MTEVRDAYGEIARLAAELEEQDRKMLAVTDRMIDLEQVLRRLLTVHTGECRLDHEGFCQEHGFEVPCAVEVARRVLAGEAL